MMQRVRYGVLGVAKIATEKVIPAMSSGEYSEVVAIASRDYHKAVAAARALGLPKAYGSYRELLADPDIDAIYNPLPNHLHKEWTIAAAESGKHVLCEKPIGMSAVEAEAILAARDRTGVKIEEAFMVCSHPQWLKAVELCRSGRLGEVRSFMGYFSYFNDDPKNIRNLAEMGGGGLMDISRTPRRSLASVAKSPTLPAWTRKLGRRPLSKSPTAACQKSSLAPFPKDAAVMPRRRSTPIGNNRSR